mmetsp:Transcript_1727/g.4884  ORF Transcript_1727/g.4884 Transcript_1727/m.4884 type:complete len:93 (-) Transcript_1727:301-579(-)
MRAVTLLPTSFVSVWMKRSRSKMAVRCDGAAASAAFGFGAAAAAAPPFPAEIFGGPRAQADVAGALPAMAAVYAVPAGMLWSGNRDGRKLSP